MDGIDRFIVCLRRSRYAEVRRNDPSLIKEITIMSATITTNGADDESWLDIEYMVACSEEADPSVTLESVRQILTKIPGSISDDITAERDEQF